jgi:hypothetical protein
MARSRLLRKSSREKINLYWGYFLLPILAWGWYKGFPPELLAALSALSSIFFLLRARMPCGALNRDGTYCRNNARGVLGGCNQVVAHKWYKAKMLRRRSTWGRFASAAFLKFESKAATFGALATCLSTLIAALALLVATFAFLDPGFGCTGVGSGSGGLAAVLAEQLPDCTSNAATPSR